MSEALANPLVLIPAIGATAGTVLVAWLGLRGKSGETSVAATANLIAGLERENAKLADRLEKAEAKEDEYRTKCHVLANENAALRMGKDDR